MAALVACGAATQSTAGTSSANVESTAEPNAKPVTRMGDVVSAPTFDAKGAKVACEAPRTDCAAESVDRAFLDRCHLAGFQVRQCGCASRCTGNVALLDRHFDGTGRVKECPPAQSDCAPATAPSAFEDACTDRGHRLEVCGCEWLCSGDPTR
jgi:hypothetical protein